MNIHAMVESCLETLIQSISKKDNFSRVQITEHLAIIFKRSLSSIQAK